MYNPDEHVETKWATHNKLYFENLGYQYTKIGDKFSVKVSDLKPNSNIKITVTCDCEGCTNSIKLPFRNYNKAIDKYGMYRCKSCSHMDNIRTRTEKSHDRLYDIFLDRCKEHDCTPITTRDSFNGCKSFVEYICPKHGLTKTFMSNVISENAWCYKCGKESMADKYSHSKEQVKQIVESKNNNILLNSDEYINSSTKNLHIICGSCKNEFITSLSAVKNGNGRCSQCGCSISGPRITKEELIELSKKDGVPMLINPDDFVDMNTKLYFKCSECGTPFLQTPHNYVKRDFTRCPSCWDILNSRGAKEIESILKEYSIKHTREYKFDDCRDIKPLPFDFYLHDYNRIIEFDGPQHFKPIEHFGGQISFERTQKHDRMKNEYCEKNNIPLLRIPYWEKQNIREIVDKFLKLNNIEDIV